MIKVEMNHSRPSCRQWFSGTHAALDSLAWALEEDIPGFQLLLHVFPSEGFRGSFLALSDLFFPPHLWNRKYLSTVERKTQWWSYFFSFPLFPVYSHIWAPPSKLSVFLKIDSESSHSASPPLPHGSTPPSSPWIPRDLCSGLLVGSVLWPLNCDPFRPRSSCMPSLLKNTLLLPSTF